MKRYSRYVSVAWLCLFFSSAACGAEAPEGSDFENRRERMVREQIEKRGIEDPDVLSAVRQVKRHRFVVVVSAEQHSPLRKANVIAECDLIEVVNPHFFAQPNVASDAELPRIFDVHSGFNHHARSYLCTKHPQQRNFGPRKRK